MTAIVPTDIVWRLSVSAAAGNTTAGTAATSLGDQASTTAWAGGSLHDLFDVVSGAENAAAVPEYRALYIYNSNAANALQNARLYLQSEQAGGCNIHVAVDNIAASLLGAATAQGAAIATETTTPSGVGTFGNPSSAATGIDLGSIPALSGRMVWIRRTPTNSAALSGDNVVLAVTGDTGSA